MEKQVLFGLRLGLGVLGPGPDLLLAIGWKLAQLENGLIHPPSPHHAALRIKFESLFKAFTKAGCS